MSTLTLFQKHILNLARYHKWAYSTLFESLNQLTDEQYKGDAGLYFRSVQGTVNHLYLSDSLWFGRFSRNPRNNVTGTIDEVKYESHSTYWGKPSPVWEAFETDRQKIQSLILEQCDLWTNYVASLTEEDLAGSFKYVTSSGEHKEQVRYYALDHLFNHGTHHRGQITAAVTHFGLKGPSIDLIYMPQELRS